MDGGSDLRREKMLKRREFMAAMDERDPGGACTQHPPRVCYTGVASISHLPSLSLIFICSSISLILLWVAC